jgi:hypothetical protein
LAPTGSRTSSRTSHPCRIGRCYSWIPSAPTGYLCPHCPSGSHLTRSLVCLFQSFPLPHLIYSYSPSPFHSLSFSRFEIPKFFHPHSPSTYPLEFSVVIPSMSVFFNHCLILSKPILLVTLSCTIPVPTPSAPMGYPHFPCS